MRSSLRRPISILCVIGALAGPAAADKQFNAGSLIIPPGAAFQTDCGAVAIYGLVYDVLRANAYIAARPLLFPNGPIEIYYSYRDTKASPNRCAPTNLSVSPAPAADPRWLDGCDFEVYNNSATPVKLVNNNLPALVNDTNVKTFDNISSNSVIPAYAPETIDNLSGHNKIRYLGGPLIIDSTDAATFLSILAGTTTVWDNAAGALPGHIVDFSPFRSLATCAYGTSVGGYVNIHRAKGIFFAPAARFFTAAPPRVALLATAGIGVSTTDLDYPTRNIEKPSKPGAKDTALGVVTIQTKSNHGLLIGAKVMVQGVGVAGYNGIVTVTGVPAADKFTYNAVGGLANSGNGSVVVGSGAKKVGTVITLTTNANHGLLAGQDVVVANVDCGLAPLPPCPGYNGTWRITSVTAKTITIDTALAPNVDPGPLANSFSGGDVTRAGAGATQSVSDGILQKYLKLAGLQFVGAGGCPPGGVNQFDAAKCPAGGVRGQIYDTFDFGDFTAGRLDSNYAMVWTPHWESTAGAASPPSAVEQTMITNIATFLDGQTGLMAECHSIEAFEGANAQGYTLGQFQTCKGAAGVCTGLTPIGFKKNLAGPGKVGNCTDPGLVNGAKCTYFGAPGDPFAQPGDFVWDPRGGSVANYIPNTVTTSIYKPYALPLISGVNSLDTSKLASAAVARGAGMIATDYVSRTSKDGDPAKGNILYMGGHDVSGVVSGTKVILQTLLLLGAPPIVQTMVEVTRSSPITSTISYGGSPTTALVQGSFEKQTPPNTTLFTNDDSTVDAFRFPDVLGHMRAVTAASVTTTQQDLSSLTTIFDAATALPATTNSYAGCGADAFGAGSGNCRTIFTHTAAGLRPARVVLDSAQAANATLLAAFNINGGTITVAKLPTLIQRIIAGIEFPAGTFIPKLGGVDRSTVAVVPSSNVAGVTRPKIIYFGAMDGMLHAVCGSELAGTGCPTGSLGRELWGFIPRLQLPNIRKNLARIDGSPRVMDLYGDFTGSGTRSFRTILMFQTGYGDPATTGMMPSVTALDITNPFDPKIVWEFALANAGSRASFEPGQGLVVNAGPVRVGGVFKNFAFIQTNNGGTGGVGNVVTAIDMEDASVKWSHTVAYPIGSIGRAGGAPPATGIPGGTVGIDKPSTGAYSDVVFGTLYGEMWQLDAATGISKEGGGNPGTPLFRFSADQHPVGTSPAIYSDGTKLFAIGVPGGYADLSTAGGLWSAASQTAVAVSLSVPVADAPVGEGVVPAAGSSAVHPPHIPWEFTLQNGDKAFAQPVIIGGEVFITTDSIDINDSSATGFGAAAVNTGRVYRLRLTDGAVQSTSVVRGGAGSVASDGTTVYVVTKDKAQQLTDNGAIGGTGSGGGAAVVAASTTGASPGSVSIAKITRLLWLRTL